MSELRNGIYVTGGNSGESTTGGYKIISGYCVGEGTASNPYVFYKDAQHTQILEGDGSHLYLDVSDEENYSIMYRYAGSVFVPISNPLTNPMTPIDSSTIINLN